MLKESRLPQDIQECWTINSSIIRKAGEDVLIVTSGKGPPDDKEAWWWNEDIHNVFKTKVEAKKLWVLNENQE